MCFHEHCSRSQVGPSSRQSCTEHIYSEMQYRKRSAKLGKVRFPCAYINFLKELIVVFVHEPVYSLQVLQTVLQFITRVTLYDGVGSGVQLNVKLWTLWLCWASWFLICGLFSTHQITENTIVLKLIASKKKLLKLPIPFISLKKLCTVTEVRMAILFDSAYVLQLRIFLSNGILNFKCLRTTEHV